MQTKDIIKQPLTTEWAVASRNSYVRKQAIVNKQVQRHQTNKVTLVNYNTYGETSTVSADPTDARFYTTTSDRTKRFLVKYEDIHTGTVYFVVPATSFIAVYSELESDWATSEVRQAQAQAEKETKDALRVQAYGQALVRKEALEASISDNIKALLGHSGWMGSRADLNIDGDFVTEDDGALKYETRIEGSVVIKYDQFMRLVEKFNQLQDA
jgi:Na+(H+)/acetate symporter ActP